MLVLLLGSARNLFGREPVELARGRPQQCPLWSRWIEERLFSAGPLEHSPHLIGAQNQRVVRDVDEGIADLLQHVGTCDVHPQLSSRLIVPTKLSAHVPAEALFPDPAQHAGGLVGNDARALRQEGGRRRDKAQLGLCGDGAHVVGATQVILACCVNSKGLKHVVVAHLQPSGSEAGFQTCDAGVQTCDAGVHDAGVQT